jgi:hypothetical protein
MTYYTVTLEVTSCGVEGCGIPFAIPRNLENDLRRTGNWFYCPNGHQIHYHDSENARLKKAAQDAIAQRDYAREQRDFARKERDTEKARRIALKGVVTKTKKRLAHGICPVCTRHFTNMERHMTSQHPTYATQPVE